MAVAEFVRCGTGTQLSYDQSDQGFVFPPIARVARTAATCADLTPRTGGGAAPFRPALGALLSNSVSAQEQGKVNGVSTALSSLMGILGPLGAGLAYDHLASVAPFWIGGCILALASVWLGVMYKQPSALVDQSGNGR